MIKPRRVVGHSMEPHLKGGQIVLISTTKSPIVGDIVVAKYQNIEVVKMLSKISKKRGIYLQGNDETHDIGWIKDYEIIGKLVWPRLKKGILI